MRVLISNCGEVAHLSTGDDECPLSGYRLREREALVHKPGMAILIEDGKIDKIGPSEDLISEFAPWYPAKNESADTRVMDVNGMAIVPGFVDSHNHLVWSGDRSNELSMRISGKSYKDIAASGGGIMKTVMETRSAPQRHLISWGVEWVEN